MKGNISASHNNEARRIGMTKSIKCINNDKIYNSIKEAADDLNLDASAITKVCKGKQKNTKGYVFIYAEDEQTHIIDNSNNLLIKCVETNKVYNTTQEISNDLDIPIKYIKKVLNGHQNSTRGYSFIYIDKINEPLNEEELVKEVFNHEVLEQDVVEKIIKENTTNDTKDNEYWFQQYLKDSKYNNYEEWYKDIVNLYRQVQAARFF